MVKKELRIKKIKDKIIDLDNNFLTNQERRRQQFIKKRGVLVGIATKLRKR